MSIKKLEAINEEFDEKGLEWLQKKIFEIDPEFYSKTDIKNPQRLKRSWRFLKQQEINYHHIIKKEKKRDFQIIKIGIKTDREDLYKTINKRVERMINDGLVEESKSLIKFKDKNALNTVGYKELFNYFDSNLKLDLAIEEIKKNTRRLAKRQLTWFRNDKTINWFLNSEKNKIIDTILK